MPSWELLLQRGDRWGSNLYNKLDEFQIHGTHKDERFTQKSLSTWLWIKSLKNGDKIDFIDTRHKHKKYNGWCAGIIKKIIHLNLSVEMLIHKINFDEEWNLLIIISTTVRFNAINKKLAPYHTYTAYHCREIYKTLRWGKWYNYSLRHHCNANLRIHRCSIKCRDCRMRMCSECCKMERCEICIIKPIEEKERAIWKATVDSIENEMDINIIKIINQYSKGYIIDCSWCNETIIFNSLLDFEHYQMDYNRKRTRHYIPKYMDGIRESMLRNVNGQKMMVLCHNCLCIIFDRRIYEYTNPGDYPMCSVCKTIRIRTGRLPFNICTKCHKSCCKKCVYQNECKICINKDEYKSIKEIIMPISSIFGREASDILVEYCMGVHVVCSGFNCNEEVVTNTKFDFHDLKDYDGNKISDFIIRGYNDMYNESVHVIYGERRRIFCYKCTIKGLKGIKCIGISDNYTLTNNETTKNIKTLSRCFRVTEYIQSDEEVMNVNVFDTKSYYQSRWKRRKTKYKNRINKRTVLKERCRDKKNRNKGLRIANDRYCDLVHKETSYHKLHGQTNPYSLKMYLLSDSDDDENVVVQKTYHKKKRHADVLMINSSKEDKAKYVVRNDKIDQLNEMQDDIVGNIKSYNISKKIKREKSLIRRQQKLKRKQCKNRFYDNGKLQNDKKENKISMKRLIDRIWRIELEEISNNKHI